MSGKNPFRKYWQSIFNKIHKYYQDYPKLPSLEYKENVIMSRISKMIAQALANIGLSGFTIWVVVKDYGISVLDDKVLFFFLLLWILMSWIMLFMGLSDLRKKSTNEKIDEITAEIRKDREKYGKSHSEHFDSVL